MQKKAFQLESLVKHVCFLMFIYLFQRHEQAEDGMGDITSGPHITLTYKNKDTFKDAANLIIHHVKRQTGIFTCIWT